MNRDASENSFDNGILWDEFCEDLKRIGQHVLRPEAPGDAFNRAEGFRYISRVLRSSLDTFVEYADPAFPVIYRPCDEIIKYGGDNPDNYYQKCILDGRREYRISGQRGSVHYLSFLTQGSNYGQDRTMKSTGFLDSNQLETDAEGNFEILVSSAKKEGNWLPMTPDTQALLIRQTFAVREQEKIAEIHIKCLNAEAVPAPMEPVAFAAGLRAATRFLDATTGLFCDWGERYQSHPNQLPPEDQEMCQKVGGDPNIHYYNSFWQLAPDEALVVEVERIPECENWNFQLCNYWMESLDYRYHRIHVNKFTAEYEKDGSVRIVVSRENPGHPNWLDTAGHGCGLMLFRWIGAKEHVHPTTRVVKTDELR